MKGVAGDDELAADAFVAGQQIANIILIGERILQVVSRCNRALFRARGEQELLQSICQILAETGDIGLAWIGYCEDDAEKTVRPVARAGDGADYLERVNHSWDPTHA